MTTPIMILGESGTGKTLSMRNLDPAQTLLIQVIDKQLPFKPKWDKFDAEKKTGNVFVTDKSTEIIALMQGTKKPIVIIDDFQYVLSNELMRRFRETGYTKFSETGYNGWNIFTVASTIPVKRIYIMAHTMTGDDGITKIKTPGKLLETYSVEGMCSMVLRTFVHDGEYFFATKNSGTDTVKSPPGMFEQDLIPNDLKLVDDAVVKFGW